MGRPLGPIPPRRREGIAMAGRTGSLRPAKASLPRLLEKAQVGRLLAFARRHQQAFGAEEIVLLGDFDVGIAFVADEFVPGRPWILVANEIARHRPGPRQ